jgi:hypothetical protein
MAACMITALSGKEGRRFEDVKDSLISEYPVMSCGVM